MKKKETRTPRPKPGEKPSITVSAFGCGALDNPDATLSAEECDALSKAWSRAAAAIRLGQYGEVRATDEDGDEMLCVMIDYDSIERPRNGYPTIATFPTLKLKKRVA